MNNNDSLKKQIIYRSQHRGSKEMDLLLGNFVKKNINFLNDSELKDLNNLIQTDDEIIKNWYFNQSNNKSIPKNKITDMLKKFEF